MKYSSIIFLFLSLFGKEVPKNIPVHFDDASVDNYHNTSEKFHVSDLFTSLTSQGEFDLDEEESDNDDCETNDTGFTRTEIPLVLRSLTACSSFQTTKPTKLYILFHSWKTHFLPSSKA